jgi:hypothetical protein
MAEVNANGGRLQMDTEGTLEAARSLSQAGTSFATAWDSIRSGIVAAEGQLGKGPMGQSFSSGYNPNAAGVVEQADSVPQILWEMQGQVEKTVQDYVRVDEESGGQMRAGG